MASWTRARWVRLGAEAALAFATGVAWFALVAVSVAAAGPDLLAVLIGVVCIAAVVAIAWTWGVAFAAPVAIASLLAFDWYRFPPTHPHEFPSSGDLAELLAYLVVAVLIGEFAAYSGRRASASEAARSWLAEEQTALRRVATLVARRGSPEEVFAAVAQEVGVLLGVDGARVIRYSGDDEIMQLAGWSAPGYDSPSLGRAKLEPTSLAGEVWRTGRAARIDDYAAIDRMLPRPVERAGARSGVGAPIVVDGKLWGAMAAWLMHPGPLPAAAEARLANFTDLIATAISNTANRSELARLADEQAALRRVATLVARESSPEDVFAAVAREVGELLGVDATHMGRYDPDGTAVGMASWSREGSHMPVGTRSPPGRGGSVTAAVLRTGRPARMDRYTDVPSQIASQVRALGIQSSVGAPIVVDERLWGVMIASSKGDERLPADTESRIAAFNELVATAISNTEARAEAGRLADEQAALRRVATLVARGVPAAEVFAAVAEELERLFDATATLVGRLEPDATMTIVANSGTTPDELAVGASFKLESGTVLAEVIHTGRAARVDDYSHAAESIGELTRRLRIRCSVAVPIMVEGSLWGALGAGTERAHFPADVEQRMAEFTELVATAISNIQARSDLAASRARIVAATDEERRRVVRDLHDGAQQRLVHTVITLKLADRALQRGDEAAPELLTEALEHAERANSELRELSHGILPAVLTRGGLRAGVEALASRMPVPVENRVSVDGCRPRSRRPPTSWSPRR